VRNASVLRSALAPGSTSKPNPSRAWSPSREPSPGRANTIRVAPRSPSHSRMASPTGRSTSRPSASRNVRTSVAWMPIRAATSSRTQESVDPVSTRRSHASLRHIDRIQDDPGMRDSHGRRSHSAPSSGLSLHVHCHRQERPVGGIPTRSGNDGSGIGRSGEGPCSRRLWRSAAAKRIQEGRPFGPR